MPDERLKRTRKSYLPSDGWSALPPGEYVLDLCDGQRYIVTVDNEKTDIKIEETPNGSR